MIFTSQPAKNFDPEPYVWPSGVRSMFKSGTDRQGVFQLLKHDPRPEYTVTRDPLPWLDPVTQGDRREVRWAEVDEVGRAFYIWLPRLEYRAPVNRILWAYRFYKVDRSVTLAWLRGYEMSEHYRPDEIEHAQKVLRRLARLSTSLQED